MHDTISMIKSWDITNILFAILGITLGLYLAHRLRVRRSLPLPPGPKGVPFLGNLYNMPTVKPWLTYKEWARSYGTSSRVTLTIPMALTLRVGSYAGDVIYMYLPLQPVIILGSARAAHDLMEKRSNIYSDKLFMTIDEMYVSILSSACRV